MTGQGWKCLGGCSEDGPGGPLWCPEGRGLDEEGGISVSSGCFREMTGQSAFPSEPTCMQSSAWSQQLGSFSPCPKKKCHPALEGSLTSSSLQSKDICILPAPLPTTGSKTEEPQQEGEHAGCPPGAGQSLPACLGSSAFRLVSLLWVSFVFLFNACCLSVSFIAAGASGVISEADSHDREWQLSRPWVN